MSLIKWKSNQNDPFKEFFNFDHPFFGLSLFPVSDKSIGRLGNFGYPALDVTEDKNNLVVKADLPGLKKENISLSVDDGILTIKGERKYEADEKHKDYHRVERAYGVFQRSLDLGGKVDRFKIKASYKNGVLEIIVPKPEKSKEQDIIIE